jgi:hypothetical protein
MGAEGGRRTSFAGGADPDKLGDLEHVRHVRRVHQLVLQQPSCNAHTFTSDLNTKQAHHTRIARGTVVVSFNV